MTVLLTGATGFLGLNLAHALFARGEPAVLFAPALPPAAAADSDWFRRAVFVQGDIRSEDDLGRAFSAAPVTRVIHAAALTPDVQAEAEQPDRIAEVNLVGTARLMQMARRAGVQRVLGLSSVAVYGLAEPGANGRLGEETTTPRPSSLYGITKLAAEQSLRRLGALYGLETLVVRLGPCFGAWEYPTGHRPLLSPHWQCVEALLADQECVLPRAMAGDWIEAGEAAGAILDLLAAPTPEDLFNLGGGATTTVVDWCQALSALHPGFRWRVDAAFATVRYGLERDRPAMDTTRLARAIGRAPRTEDLIERARRYLLWREGPHGRALCAAGGAGHSG